VELQDNPGSSVLNIVIAVVQPARDDSWH